MGLVVFGILLLLVWFWARLYLARYKAWNDFRHIKSPENERVFVDLDGKFIGCTIVCFVYMVVILGITLVWKTVHLI